jgi:hypothetical protein
VLADGSELSWTRRFRAWLGSNGPSVLQMLTEYAATSTMVACRSPVLPYVAVAFSFSVEGL